MQTILSFCEPLLENLWENINNTYASHVVRTVLEILSGVKVMNGLLHSSSYQPQEKAVDFSKLLLLILNNTLKNILDNLSKLSYILMCDDK